MAINLLRINVFVPLQCIKLMADALSMKIARMALLGMEIYVNQFNVTLDLFGTDQSAHLHL